MGSKKSIFRLFPKTFWVANTMELFERWAWYGMFNLFALYLTGSIDDGALGFSQAEKGYIMGPIVGLLYFFPVFTGAIADKVGYKKILVGSYVVMSTGYLILAWVQSFWAVYFAFFYLAIGAAFFKPIIASTVARTTTEKTASIGFGIFYMMVNIGAFFGPFLASFIREISWHYMFLCSAAAIIMNFILVFFFYKEPEREVNKDPLGKAILVILRNIFSALRDIKFLAFLILVAGFWSMYNQLFYSLPVFIDQWFDTSALYTKVESFWPWLAEYIGTDDGLVKPEMIVNVDALYIIILQIAISAIVMKMKPINAMTTGFIVSAVGIGLTFMTDQTYFIFIAILVFGIGEMAGSPKITEYIGRIAPREKMALYIGCSFIPSALGNFFAGILSGNVYTSISDKTTLLQREIAERGINIPEISDSFTLNEYFAAAATHMNMTGRELTKFLWEKYHPSDIWYVFTGIGIATAVLLFLYNKLWVGKESHMEEKVQ